MNRKKYSNVVVVIFFITIVLIGAQKLRKHMQNSRSFASRVRRFIKGENLPLQRANDLAEDIKTIQSLRQIQSWAENTMTNYQLGVLDGKYKSSLYWVEADKEAFTLSRVQVPQFIMDQWGTTNKYYYQPQISIVLSNNLPCYVVIFWDNGNGIIVGHTNYLFSFGVENTNRVAPGIYTYSY